MKTRFHKMAALAILLAAFLAGLFSAPAPTLLPMQPASREASQHTPLPRSGFLGVDSRQVIVLILGVDRHAPQHGTLQAVWVATFRLPSRDIYLTGLPVDWRPQETPEFSLREIHAQAGMTGVGQALVEIIPVPLSATIVLDASGFAVLVDTLGGGMIEGEHVDGPRAAARIDLLEAQPQALLTTQARLLDSLRTRVARLGAAPDLAPWTALMPERARSDLPAVSLITLLSPLLPLDPENIHIQLLE